VTSDLPAQAAAMPGKRDDGREWLGYPLRAMVAFAALLALAVVWLVLPAGRGAAWTFSTAIGIGALALLWWRTRLLSRVRERSAHVLAALGSATADIPVTVRTRMPLVLLTGDGLPALFDRDGEKRFAHVGNGAIWLRIDRPQDLPQLAVAVRQWRDGLAPDGIVLSVAPALHSSADMLTQKSRAVRQAVADASRMLGAKLPGYVAVYQRLTPDGPSGAVNEAALGGATTGHADLAMPQWYGISSATRLADAPGASPLESTLRFEQVVGAAEDEVRRNAGDRATAIRAAALASIVGWTRQVVLGPLTDRQQPAAPWPLFGAGWLDCGPASGPDTPWERDVARRTRVTRAEAAASPLPWPLPQPLIEAMPRRRWASPRTAAFAHALALLACAATVAFWCAAKNNEALLARVGADLSRYSAIPAAHDASKRDALKALVADRDQLDRYARAGVPLRLSFGMYRGTALMAALDDAIASYVPPPPPPAVVTLDSMSLFDSGKSQLKPGSTRAMVGALDMIKAHPDKRILVAGHTDDVGNADNNLKLSIARAGAVRDWLTDASGMPATQFAIQGYGDMRPIAGNASPEGRAQNRRVEITLVPDAPPKEVPPRRDGSATGASDAGK
jgi:outer membrane protein OmpA-like peptidoglycan-associated protein